eukprot:9495851-Pyramimonas_sp.AAC.2
MNRNSDCGVAGGSKEQGRTSEFLPTPWGSLEYIILTCRLRHAPLPSGREEQKAEEEEEEDDDDDDALGMF